MASEKRNSKSISEAKAGRLLAAATVGLLGVGIVACGDAPAEDDNVQKLEKGVKLSKTTQTLNLDEFSTLCDQRLGLVELHASCGGVNTCKGVSYNGGTLLEHTCRASNTCAGMSCVELAADQNRSGAAILQETGDAAQGPYCNYCHGNGETVFRMPVDATADLAAVEAAFKAKTDAQLVQAIAFGISGYKSNGTHYANMPGFYKRYSRREIEEAVKFLRTLPLEIKAPEHGG